MTFYDDFDFELTDTAGATIRVERSLEDPDEGVMLCVEECGDNATVLLNKQQVRALINNLIDKGF